MCFRVVANPLASSLNMGTPSQDPLKKAHLLRWLARALAAAYLEYALTHLRCGAPRTLRAALHLPTFLSNLGENRFFSMPTSRAS